MSMQPIDDRGEVVAVLKPRQAKSQLVAFDGTQKQTTADFESDIDVVTIEVDQPAYIRFNTSSGAAVNSDGTDKYLRANWSYQFSLGGQKGKANAQRFTRVSVTKAGASNGNIYISQDE